MLFVEADENRYEGSWKKDKKNGPGKFYYLDKGQVYEGVWLDGVPKCGEMKDFGRDHAPDATQYELPKVRYHTVSIKSAGYPPYYKHLGAFKKCVWALKSKSS